MSGKKEKKTKKKLNGDCLKKVNFSPFFQVFNFFKYKSCYKSLQISHSSETEMKSIFLSIRISLYQVPKRKKQNKNFFKHKSCYKSLQIFQSSETEIETIFFMNKNVTISGTKEKKTKQKFKWRLSEKKLIFRPFFNFLIFLNSSNNNFAMPEVGTIEGYINRRLIPNLKSIG